MSIKALSEYTRYAKYSRYNKEKKRRETWEEQVNRVFDMHEKHLGNKLDTIKDEFYFAKDMMMKKKILGSQRALQFGGDPILQKNEKIYNCLQKNTKFITNEGVKSFEDFNHGDKVVVLTHKGNWKEATVKKFGVQKLFKYTFKRNSDETDVFATKNHRWILSDESETDNLQIGDVLFKQPAIFEEFDYDSASIDEKMYWAYGLVYGEGTKLKNSNGEYAYSMIRLCGKDKQFKSRFEELGFNTNTNMSLNGDFYAYTETYLKTLPDIKIDGVNLVRAFVRGFLDADGAKNRNVSFDMKDIGPYSRVVSIQQSSEEAINFIKNIFPVVGAYVISERKIDKETNFGKHNAVSFRLSCNGLRSTHNVNWKVKDISNDYIEEEVWCLEVEDDHSFVLSNGIVTGNCSASYADRVRVFQETEFLLLCGCGVGISVQKHHINKLPNIQLRTKGQKTFIIPDSIEGWADAIGVLVSSYFTENVPFPEYQGYEIIFDYSLIRPEGAHISWGGKAPGPKGLNNSIQKITTIFENCLNKGRNKLKPIEVYDILMHESDSVLSGGIRRSATIILFSPDDEEMAKAKTGDWFMTNPQRGRSNNSAVLVRNTTTKEEFAGLMKSVKDFGEPGFIWTDDTEILFNPCLTSDTWILTSEGPRQIQDLIGKPFDAIVNGEKFASTDKGFVYTGTMPVFKLETDMGFEIKCTNNHKFIILNKITNSDEWKELKDIQVGDSIVVSYDKNNLWKDNLSVKESFERLSMYENNKYVTVKNITEIGVEDVYDCAIPEVHCFDANGIVSHNCCEIALYGYDEFGNSGFEFCNLTTINAKKCKTDEDFYLACKASAILGTIQASYDKFPYLGEVTERIVKREALLGCSMTGIMDNPSIALNPETQQKGAEIIKEVNKDIAKRIGINQAARTTTVKPEGSASCLLGSSSGIHPSHAKRYIRRVQANKNEFPAQYFSMYNPRAVEESVWSANKTDVVLSFLCEVPDGARLKNSTSAIDLLNNVKLTQQNWVSFGKNDDLCVKPWLNHNVSNTCFSSSTRFMTDKGLRRFDDFNDGDSVVVYDYKGEKRNAMVKNFGKQKIFELELTNGKNKKIIETTLNHIWLMCNKSGKHRQSENDNFSKHLTYKMVKTENLMKFKNGQIPRIIIKEERKLIPEAFCHGLIFGDGSKHKEKINESTHIKIFDECKKKLSKYLFDNNLDCSISIKDDHIYIGKLNKDWKKLPVDQNSDYIFSFISGWFAADGSVASINDNQRSITLTTKEKQHIDWLYDNACVAGFTVNSPTSFVQNSGFNSGETYWTISFVKSSLHDNFFEIHEDKFKKWNQQKKAIQNSKYYSVVSLKDTGRIEDVYCVVEPETSTFLLEDNILTHNCTVFPHEWQEVEDFIYDNRKWFAGISLLPASGDLDYPQAPFTTVLTHKEIIEKYGEGALFASGLIVDGLSAFENNLWAACDSALGIGQKLEEMVPPEEPVMPVKNGYTDKVYAQKLKEYTEQLNNFFIYKESFDKMTLKLDWVRRFKQFASRYSNNNLRECSHLLKYVHNWKLWLDLKREYSEIDWSLANEEEFSIDVTTLGAQACAGGACELK